MAEEKFDKVLVFLMLGGAMLASEGQLDNIAWELGRFNAVRPDNHERYTICLANCLSVNLVPRDSVVAGAPKIVVPGGRMN